MKQQFRFVRNHALGSRAPIRALKNIIMWQIRARMQRSVRCSWVDGSVLIAGRGMTGATGNLYVGLHEFADMGFLLHLLRPSDFFVDVGANIGSYTVLASRVCGAHALAFEPDPETLEHLTENIRANGIADLVTSEESAVGAEIGSISFSMNQDTVNHVVEASPAAHTKGTAEQFRTVAITTLDAAVADRHPVLIKIDVEGHEPAVVAGAANILLDQSLKAIIIESVDDVILASLSGHGFERYAYDPFERRLVAGAAHKWGGNYLFLRDEAFVAERLRTAPRRTILGQSV